MQQSPNGWSCLAVCFANMLGITLEQVIKDLGHDGSEIISNDPEPTCRRAFDTQELILYALLTHETEVIYVSEQVELVGDYVLTTDLIPYIEQYPGIVCGKPQFQSYYHAWYWDGNIVHDPSQGFMEKVCTRPEFFLLLPSRVFPEKKKSPFDPTVLSVRARL